MVKLDVNKWIRPADFEDGDLKVKILNEGETKPPEETGLSKDVFEIKVQLPDGTEKLWTMNKTSQRALVTKYGDETAEWINKEVDLFVSEVQFKGKMVKAIFARLDGTPKDKSA